MNTCEKCAASAAVAPVELSDADLLRRAATEAAEYLEAVASKTTRDSVWARCTDIANELRRAVLAKAAPVAAVPDARIAELEAQLRQAVENTHALLVRENAALRQCPPGTPTWKAIKTKDGKRVLKEAFYAFNPHYIAVHNDWEWEQIAPAAPAVAAASEGWISVDERLPEDGERVLVAYWPFDNKENRQAVADAEH